MRELQKKSCTIWTKTVRRWLSIQTNKTEALYLESQDVSRRLVTYRVRKKKFVFWISSHAQFQSFSDRIIAQLTFCHHLHNHVVNLVVPLFNPTSVKRTFLQEIWWPFFLTLLNCPVLLTAHKDITRVSREISHESYRLTVAAISSAKDDRPIHYPIVFLLLFILQTPSIQVLLVSKSTTTKILIAFQNCQRVNKRFFISQNISVLTWEPRSRYVFCSFNPRTFIPSSLILIVEAYALCSLRFRCSSKKIFDTSSPFSPINETRLPAANSNFCGNSSMQK